MHLSSYSSALSLHVEQRRELHPFSNGGQSTREEAVMCLLDAFISFSFLLLVLHSIIFLLAKLFSFLLERAENSQCIDEEEAELKTQDVYSDNRDLDGGIFSFKDTLLVQEEKDSNHHHHHILVADESFVGESSRQSPSHEHDESFKDIDPVIDIENPPDLPPSIIPNHEEGTNGDEESVALLEESLKNKNGKKKLFIPDRRHVDDDNKRCDQATEEEKETLLGGSLTGESTSRSSMEWRSSAIFKDSETECPFSSSSRRSSSRWESYALFRRYDEEMMLFDRISAQKLSETESFRSMNFRPRSISQRLVHKFSTKRKGVKDPHKELESAYVGQICLSWEALNWNYCIFRQESSTSNSSSSCSTWMAEQFQQFHVLLQRFMENEPYERGRRPEVFARTRSSSRKLLHVPELRDCEGDTEDKVSSTELLGILKGAIRTFMSFLKAEKGSPGQLLRALIRRKSSSVDPNLLHFLKRTNRIKKRRLEDMLKRRRCLKKKRLSEEEEIEILMGLIDMKVVSRILKMADISQQQLHWCEEKMTKLRVWDGKVRRDPSPLFFPVN